MRDVFKLRVENLCGVIDSNGRDRDVSYDVVVVTNKTGTINFLDDYNDKYKAIFGDDIECYVEAGYHRKKESLFAIKRIDDQSLEQ